MTLILKVALALLFAYICACFVTWQVVTLDIVITHLSAMTPQDRALGLMALAAGLLVSELIIKPSMRAK